MPNYSDNVSVPLTGEFISYEQNQENLKAAGNYIPCFYLPQKGYYIGWTIKSGLKILSDRSKNNNSPLHFIVSEKHKTVPTSTSIKGVGSAKGTELQTTYSEHPESLLKEIVSKKPDYTDLLKTYVQPRCTFPDRDSFKLDTEKATIVW